MNKFTDSHELTTAAYAELIDRYGMQPRCRLVRSSSDAWSVMDPDSGMTLLNHNQAVQLMAEYAQVWMRDVIGIVLELDEKDLQRPGRIIRSIRDLARTRFE